jgi:hypothetical protein
MKWRTIGPVLGLTLLMCTPALASDYVIQVGPPTGPDDTGLIQGALFECVNSHPEGCTVQLDAGTYMIQQLFAENFHGTFKGKGMDLTILQGLPNLEVNQSQPVWENPPSLANKYPMLILFFRGDITVSDMTITDLEISPTKGWFEYEGEPPGTMLWALLQFMAPSEEMNVVVTRVAMKGAYAENGPGFDGYNATGYSLDPYPPYPLPSSEYLAGTFRVSACRFDTLLEGIYGAIFRDARFIIGGSPSKANLFRNCDFGTVLVDVDSGVVDFSYNDVGVVGPSGLAGFAVFQAANVPISTVSPFLVQHNRFKATGGYEDGIWLVDFGTVSGEGKTGDFVISDNEITIAPSENGPAYAGIEAVLTEGAIVSNNRITGSGLFGIAVESSTEAMVKANNVQQVTAEVAPIFLDEEATDCTVVGFGGKTNVLDLGVNNNLVGVKNMHGNPPGPAIRDAMNRKMEIIKSMRKP